MTTKRKRLEAVGRAILEGRPDAIRVQVTDSARFDPLKNLHLDRKKLVRSDFSEMNLESYLSIGSRFMQCSFRNVRIRDAVWGAGKTRSEYVECCFDGAKFRSIAPGDARFVRCSFRGVRIYEFFAFRIEFIDCVFSGRIDKGFLNGARERKKFSFFAKTRNEITGNDFSDCDLRDFGFRTGIDLDKQKLPMGSQYLYIADVSKVLRVTRPIINLWEDTEVRRLAMILLDGMEHDLKAGQEQQILRIPSRGDFAVPAERLRQTIREVV
jgi:hypothetical protein